MTISRNVYNQLFAQAADREQVIRLQPTEAKAGAVVYSSKQKIQMWTAEEHERFLQALEMYPAGPWKKIAEYIGTKTPRQTMTHAQKYRQKIHRRQRGLRNQRKKTDEEQQQQQPPQQSNLTAHSPYSVDQVHGMAESHHAQRHYNNENQDLNLLACATSILAVKQQAEQGKMHSHSPSAPAYAHPASVGGNYPSAYTSMKPCYQRHSPPRQVVQATPAFQVPTIKDETLNGGNRALPSLANLLREMKQQPESGSNRQAYVPAVPAAQY